MTEDERSNALIHFLLTDSIRRSLVSKHGVLLHGDSLCEPLGFSTMTGFRKARSKGILPVDVFPLENKRGSYALCDDVALWLATQRLKTWQEKGGEPPKQEY